MLDTSDGFESLIPGESECIYETEIKKEITKSESTIDVCHTQVLLLTFEPFLISI